MKSRSRHKAVLALLIVAVVGVGFAIERAGSERGAAAQPRQLEIETLEQPAGEPAGLAADLGPAERTQAQTETAQMEAAGPASGGAGPQAGAVLRVTLLGKERREPIASERVYLLEAKAQPAGVRFVAGARAALHEVPLTDASGRAEFEAEAGVAYRLGIHGRTETLAVAAMSVGEVREVEFELTTEPDLHLFGRLLDAETGAGIASGVVRTRSRGRTEDGTHVPTLADGSFELFARSWTTAIASAVADGYASVSFTLEPGHETPDRPLEVRLKHSATLEVAVDERGRAVAGAVVELSTDMRHVLMENVSALHFASDAQPAWTATTDSNGIAEVASLPSDVPLDLSVGAAGRPKQAQAEPISLRPGERKRVEVHLGTGATIVGRVETRAGEPLEKREVWRVAAEVALPKLLDFGVQPAAKARSDGAGRFVFEDVPAGAWHVGLPSRGQNAGTLDDVAVAEVVQIEANSREVEVVLRVDQGLFLKGTVVTPDGGPAPHRTVQTILNGTWVFFMGQSDRSGRFTLGPLPQGTYSLQALAGEGGWADSAAIPVEAGATDIELRLRVGGSFSGRVVDAAGRLRACEVTLGRGEGSSYWLTTHAPQGTFVFEGELPGTFGIGARTADDLCGFKSGLVLQSEQRVDGIEIVLRPGASVSLRYEGSERWTQCELVVSDFPWAENGIERGTPARVVVPAGDLLVRSNGVDRTRREQRVTLSVGEERELVWDGKP